MNKKNSHYDILETPIRGEIFSPERLEHYAVYLAEHLEISTSPSINHELLFRVEDNCKILFEIYKKLTTRLQEGHSIPFAGEWLVDNFFIIEDQIREIRQDLPKEYYDELPKIKSGELAHYPRIYSMALTLIAHQDSHLEVETIKQFAQSFQTVTPLMSGEIWAIPITLRIALIENLRRLMVHVIHTEDLKQEVDAIADKILLDEKLTPKLQEELKNLFCKSYVSDCVCIAQLSKRLRDHSTGFLPIYDLLSKHLSEKKTTIDEVIHSDHLFQAITQVSVGNIVTSMRLLSTCDWQEFFENVSLVDPLLSEDPSGVYKKMDFATRDRYRHVIEGLSKKSDTEELGVAALAVKMARETNQHVGHFLIGHGLRELENILSTKLAIREKIRRFILGHPTLAYMSFLGLLMCYFYFLLLSGYQRMNFSDFKIFFLSALALIPLTDTAITLLNLSVNLTIPPRILPKIELKGKIPDEAKTFIIIPTIFCNKASVDKLIESLEIHYLSNNDPNLFFALLSDFSDAQLEVMPEDMSILELADKRINELNKKYFKESIPPRPQFFLFHRPRFWNESEGKWMGWERKRGKLEQFNLFLRGKIASPFLKTAHAPEMDLNFFLQIKYVITLDSDTIMPRDSAKKLIGIILHPSNAPHFLKDSSRISSGYCILQPRISITTTSSTRSVFSKIYCGHTGIDPYTTAVSDVYQDLFAEGSFVGKGLYDVDAFITCLENKIEENKVLSHDLIEGIMARTALITDVEFLDDYPSHYEAFAKRLHRWIRGDWQISSWLFSNGKDKLSLLSRWKIFDNLRRSLVATTTFLWLVFSWILTGTNVLEATLLALFFIFFPVLASSLNFLCHCPKHRRLKWHVKNVARETFIHLIQISLSILFLPHQAYLQLDAIIRTLYRMNVSKKNLLEWRTAADTEALILDKSRLSTDIISTTITLTTLSLFAVLLTGNLAGLLVAAPFLAMWFSSPYIIHIISKTKDQEVYQFSSTEITDLRLTARRTWLFFETFVTEKDNWLVPDNFQEDPKPMIAHRTSPTNMGVLLLSSAAAYDFGYLCTLELLTRLENTQSTMENLARKHGHFFNWYDTISLAPLHPVYISTVDSGNLAAHLITMKSACLDFLFRPFIEQRAILGLLDVLTIMQQGLEAINDRYLTTSMLPKDQNKNNAKILLLSLIEENKLAKPATCSDWRNYCISMREGIEKFSDILNTLIHMHGENIFHSLNEWTAIALKTIKNTEIQIRSFDPWAVYNLDQFCASLKSRMPSTFLLLESQICDIRSHQEKILEARLIPAQYQQLLHNFGEIKKTITAQCKDSYLPPDLGIITEEIENGLTSILEFSKDYRLRLQSLAKRYDELAMSFDFTFLYNKERKIFSIGYNVSEGKMDNSFYDLLASEARVASFFAIAKGDVPQTHWFHLGRQMSKGHGHRALVSWSATMFEYLMPLLVMKNYTNTLLDQTYEATVRRQIAYGNEIGLPWGISESGYNARDLHQSYQYGPFGIPGMGLKYGLASDQVISPYSSALAAMVDPKSALINFHRLKRENAFGKYGFYESIDYTKERLQKGQKFNIIKSFMVHHQGMIIIALDNVLNRNIMQDRFHADPIVRSTELLLQEKIPEHSAIVSYQEEKPFALNIKEETFSNVRYFKEPLSQYPQVQILSNGQYSIMLSTVGAGFSVCNGQSIHRWNEDPTLETNGSFIYLRDHHDNKIYSNTFAPLNEKHGIYRASFTEHKIEFWRKDENIGCHTEIVVSPEDNVELKVITLNNTSQEVRDIDLTSYLEPVLARAEDDRAHFSFSKLFLETEYIPSKNALLFHRRKRSANDKERWGIHVVVTNGEEYSPVEFETDRSRFIGRGRTLANPIAITENAALSNMDGTSIDPIISLRQFLRIDSGESVKICFTTGIADSREQALRLIDQYHDIHSFQRESELSWTRTQAHLRHLNLTHTLAHLFQELAGSLIYSTPVMRPLSESMKQNKLAQDKLWAHGISGDNPLLVLNVAGERDILLVRLLLRAHEYLRLKRIYFDMVIISNELASYRMSFHDELIRQTQASGTFELLNKSGGIFLLSGNTLPEEDKLMFSAYARVEIDSNRGSLKEQLQRIKSKTFFPKFHIEQRKATNKKKYKNIPISMPRLEFFNGLGGFSPEGDQYVLYLGNEQSPPAPWINVIANSDNFGFLVSENGSGYTWSANSRENRLTPWSNDPVSDQGGEAIYIRDEETHEVWSPCPWPIRTESPYLIRHGMGFSKFEYNGYGLGHELIFFASLNDHVKIARLTLKNHGSIKRKISLTFFAEWILGNNKAQSSHFIVTEKPEYSKALTARNPFSNDFHGRMAFVAISEDISSYTCDRSEFLGRNGSFQNPLGMRMPMLKNKAGAGLDPCGALRSTLEIGPEEEIVVILLLGQASDGVEVARLINLYLDKNYVSTCLEEVHQFWKKTTGTIQIKTPAPELDFMCNHWLLYQTLSCRIWARSALYQSGGAYGFRDQLQDIMGLVYSHPEIAREHILKAAAHQFPEGDVQHWWHPPYDKGVRTHFSDDLLWLPYVVVHYIKKTADQSILDESVAFVEAPLLSPELEDLYVQPGISSIKSSLYDHCIRAIEHSLKKGAHGLPLMGAGDWNDGMNKVGMKGTGESVWVGWFLAKILTDFSVVCANRGDNDKETHFINYSKELIRSIESSAWDGSWYLRAFFDDGTPLGSSKNDECKIDSLTQSWSVLTGLGNSERQSLAMDEVERKLVLKKEKLCLLFTPPFNHTHLNPGYIKGYPPGIRENGGQYTHAAIWASMAFTLLKNNNTAYEILSNINPINRSINLHGIHTYRLEPYVLSADIYYGKNYSGRGGWSWYTGSSSLYYQAALEYILGMKKTGDIISFSPCIPSSWKKFEIIYKYESAVYLFNVINRDGATHGTTSIEMDGKLLPTDELKLTDDGRVHHVLVNLIKN
ncbi:MAG: glucoamylase family protein [Bacteriovorax sp.]|jgi:cyclic beta-1,2-glucan synthetase